MSSPLRFALFLHALPSLQACAGALAWSQLGTLIYGATDERRGFARLKENILHPKTKIITNILKEDCEAILKKFFQQLRN